MSQRKYCNTALKMIKLNLVRHGETDWNKLGFAAGQADIPLNENGVHQAENISEKISENFHNLRFDVILCSPLSRAAKTVEIINQRLNLPIFSTDELTEVGCREFEGKPYISNDLWDRWMLGENIGIGMESYISVQNRLKIVVEIIEKYHNPLIVGHSGIFYHLCSYLGITPPHFKNSTLYSVDNLDNRFYEISEV